MSYLTSFRRRCSSVEQYYTIKEKLDKNLISGENEVNLPTIKRIVSRFSTPDIMRFLILKTFFSDS